MEGTVIRFNATRGLGWICGSNGHEYFVHHSDVCLMHGIVVLLPDWTVEFDPTADAKKRKQAKNVRIKAIAGLTVRDRGAPLGLASKHWANLRIDSLGRIYALEGLNAITPEVEASGLRCFFAGRGPAHLRGVNLTLPASTAQMAAVLLDQDKNVRRPRDGDRYEGATAGSYLVVVHADGRVLVWNLGRRIQGPNEMLADHWLVIERRFEHAYDLRGEVSEQTLVAQTPTSGLARDNDGFIPGVIAAWRKLQPAAV